MVFKFLLLNPATLLSIAGVYGFNLVKAGELSFGNIIGDFRVPV